MSEPIRKGEVIEGEESAPKARRRFTLSWLFWRLMLIPFVAYAVGIIAHYTVWAFEKGWHLIP